MAGVTSTSTINTTVVNIMCTMMSDRKALVRSVHSSNWLSVATLVGISIRARNGGVETKVCNSILLYCFNLPLLARDPGI